MKRFALAALIILVLLGGALLAETQRGQAEKEFSLEDLPQPSCAIEREGELVTVVVKGRYSGFWCRKFIREWSPSEGTWRDQRERAYPELDLVCEMTTDESDFQILDGGSQAHGVEICERLRRAGHKVMIPLKKWEAAD